MANPQTSSSQKRRSIPQATQPGRRTSAGRSGQAGRATVERDDTYGLISVIYHALQGAETTGQYVEDARAADNEELVAFFEECKAQQNELAMKGKRLLAEQLFELIEEDEDDAMDDEDES